jgi:hypothetical protein
MKLFPDFVHRGTSTKAIAFIGDSVTYVEFDKARAELPNVNILVQVACETFASSGPKYSQATWYHEALARVPADACYTSPGIQIRDLAMIYFTSGAHRWDSCARRGDKAGRHHWSRKDGASFDDEHRRPLIVSPGRSSSGLPRRCRPPDASMESHRSWRCPVVAIRAGSALSKLCGAHR